MIGAGVYRGSQFPELVGKYIFSDFLGGQLWTAESVSTGYNVEQIGSVTSGFPNGINSYLLDSKGNILMAKTSGGLDANGEIQFLTNLAPPTEEPPQFLSQTGAFSNLADLTVNQGCIPYEMNVPFWSDNAAKSRWMCIPNDGFYDTPDEQIAFSEFNEWEFPVGSVFIKHFELQLDHSDPNSFRRLETRFIVHAEDGYYGVTYRWDDFSNDAELLTTSEELMLDVTTALGTHQQNWYFPSRNDCVQCHSSISGGALGPNTRQLNRTEFYPQTGRTSNQLETLDHLNIFNPGISNIQSLINNTLTSAPTDDTSASLTDRARSYLDSNCAYCHRPSGVRANFDARLSTPLALQEIIDGELIEGGGTPGEAVVVPGSITQSILFHRANSVGEGFTMPPLAKDLIDEVGMDLLREWILALGGAVVGNDTSSDGGFIDGHHPSLFINEEDLYTHDNASLPLTADTFEFYARKLGNPVTPIVVKVNGDNDFTVLAIGTTRTQSEYFVGQNSFPFNDGGPVDLFLSTGDVIATGFIDSNPDGSGWGDGSVIPAEANGGGTQDEIWALLPSPLILESVGFDPGRDTPSVAVGENPLTTNAGKSVSERTNLRRSYKFSISFSIFNDTGGNNNGSDIGPLSDADASADEVNESAAPGTQVGITAEAIDPDAGDSVSYSLSVNPGNAFAINATTGVVSVQNSSSLDFESAQTVSLEVTGTSSDTSTSSAVFDVTLLDDPNEGCLLYTSPSPRD